MADKTYTFVSANKGEILITVDGEYQFGTKDISIDVNGELYTTIWDTDDAADVINWLTENGVRFESNRSMTANCWYVQGVLIDGDMSAEDVWDQIAAMTDEEIADDIVRLGIEVPATEDEPTADGDSERAYWTVIANHKFTDEELEDI